MINAIERNKSELCCVWFSLVNYITSTRFQLPKIVQACHRHGIFCLVDLAHAMGSVPVKLHDWAVDAAAWCSYKYLNSGPGCAGGIFVHEKHKNIAPGMQGWFGNSRKTQFEMNQFYEPEADARRF